MKVKQKKLICFLSRRGSVLILTLWTIALLSIFAVQIGLGLRQRVSLMSRLESRSQMRFLGESGLKKAIAMLVNEISSEQETYTTEGKSLRHNNADSFKDIKIGSGQVSVIYEDVTYGILGGDNYYGFVDEERKININTASHQVMRVLFEDLLNVNESHASALADAIIGWREYGDKELNGFYSDAYYSSLTFPYEVKHAEFELMEELLLVKGFNEERVNLLRKFITIYGDGRVNINTASVPVLKALGCSQELAEIIDLVRRGADGLESTEDDFIFKKTFDVVSDILSFASLSAEEKDLCDSIVASQVFKTSSRYYFISARAALNQHSMMSTCVYNVFENRIESYREK